MSAPIARPRPAVGVDHSDDVDVPTAEEFLNALGPRNAGTWGNDPTVWIHRGHANADWLLHAKAVRDKAFEPYGFSKPVADWSSRRDAENLLLERFRRGLDASGIVIPSHSPEVMVKSRTVSGAFPDPQAFPLMALAQHHGLPTPLLDWTRRAAIAAYFAAYPVVVGEPGVGTHVAVWSLCITDVEEMNTTLVTRHGTAMTYEAPGGTNPNLRAQAGLFTVMLGDKDIDLGHALSAAKDEDATAAATFGPHSTTPRRPIPRLRRTTVPSSEAGLLLRSLSYEGIDGASLFPGPDGVVRALKERARWDTRPVGAKP
jgi:hypothetical protein